tara:strand:- start:16 stop:603 length:588 start_codon:yes stop_codon:yes gene_type:complete
MIMYSAPVLLLSLVSSAGSREVKRSKKISKRALLGILGLTISFSLIVYSQMPRILAMLSGDDGSFIGRIGLPILYMFSEWQDVIFGSGPTPLNNIDAFINDIWITNRPWLVGEDFRIAVAPSVVTVIGMGLIGTILFVVLVSYSLGALWVLLYFYCNFFANGVNGPSMLVPLAVIFGMYLSYTRSKALTKIGPYE